MVLFREKTGQQHCQLSAMVFVVLIFAYCMCYVVLCGTLAEQHRCMAFAVLVLADSGLCSDAPCFTCSLLQLIGRPIY